MEKEEKLALSERGEEELVEWAAVLALKLMDYEGLAELGIWF